MPLEEILGLTHPSTTNPRPVMEDKRTWRVNPASDNEPRLPGSPYEIKWTAMDIMTAYALRRGWLTAKAGRPDVNRAGNAILRAVAESRVQWAFWPPGSEPSRTRMCGIWILDKNDVHSTVPRSWEKFEHEDEDDDELSDDGDTRPPNLADRRNSDSTLDEETDSEDCHGYDLKASIVAGSFGILAEDDTDHDEVD